MQVLCCERARLLYNIRDTKQTETNYPNDFCIQRLQINKQKNSNNCFIKISWAQFLKRTFIGFALSISYWIMVSLLRLSLPDLLYKSMCNDFFGGTGHPILSCTLSYYYLLQIQGLLWHFLPVLLFTQCCNPQKERETRR